MEKKTTFTEIVPFGKRLKNALSGVIAGFILIAIATMLLYWNEGNAVRTANTINKAEEITINLPNVDILDSTFNAKLVHASSFAKTDDILKDNSFDISKNAIALKRNVEFYQWEETSDTDNDTTTYTYHKVWSEFPINSDNFHSNNYKNTIVANIRNKTFYAENVQFGAYRLPRFLIEDIGGAKEIDLNFSEKEIDNIKHNFLQKKDANLNVFVQDNILHFSQNVTEPNIGDIRITFYQTNSAEVSIIAKVNNDTFEQFSFSETTKVHKNKDEESLFGLIENFLPSDSGTTFARLDMGSVSKETMFENARTENAITTWIFRFVGIVVMIAGFGAILKPISVLVSAIPFLGYLAQMGISIISFILGLSLSLSVIAIAWVRFRPTLGYCLLAIAGLLILYALKKILTKK